MAGSAPVHRRFALVVAGAILIVTASVTAGRASAGGGVVGALCPPTVVPPPARVSTPLTYGVTDNRPAAADAALVAGLRGGAPSFGIHDYVSAGNPVATTAATLAALTGLARKGNPVTLTIDDEDGLTPPSTTAFVAFVRSVVDSDGRNLAAIEIGNEPNLPSPTTSDGANAQIVTDLVQGVVAAKQEVRRLGDRIEVGFNYVYAYGSPLDDSFWARLRAAADATPAFRADIDWMGLHTYPNLLSADVPLAVLDGPVESQAMATGRCYLDSLGVSSTVPIRITEVGYPTNLGTAEYSIQAEFWTRVLATVEADSRRYGVDQLFAFLLQDGASQNAGGAGSAFGLYDTSGLSKPAARVFAAAVSAG